MLTNFKNPNIRNYLFLNGGLMESHSPSQAL